MRPIITNPLEPESQIKIEQNEFIEESSRFYSTSLYSSDDFFIEAINEMKKRYDGHKYDRTYLDISIASSMLKKYGYSAYNIKKTLIHLSE